MKTEVTFEGLTKEDIIGRMNYAKKRLESNLHVWERKEYEALVEEYEFKLNDIKEREKLFA